MPDAENDAPRREIEALSAFAKSSAVYEVLKRHTGILVHVDYPHRACTCGWDWPEGARVRTDPAVAERLGLTLQELRNRDLNSTGLMMVRDWVWRAHLAQAIETEARVTSPAGGCAHVYPDGTRCTLTDHSAPGVAEVHGYDTPPAGRITQAGPGVTTDAWGQGRNVPPGESDA